MTIQDFIKASRIKLEASQITSTPDLDAKLLVMDALSLTKERLIMNIKDSLESNNLAKLESMLEARLSGQPIAYITGFKEFYSREFIVNEDVLVPRPDSELIIDQLLANIPRDLNTIVDVGTGSGALIITAALEIGKIHAIGLDISPAALKVARSNARLMEAKVRFIQSDILGSLPNIASTRNYVIISNLPYIPNDMKLPKDVMSEPNLALFSGPKGLDHYQRMFSSIAKLKHKPSLIITESLETQHIQLSGLATKCGYKIIHTKGLAQTFTRIG